MSAKERNGETEGKEKQTWANWLTPTRTAWRTLQALQQSHHRHVHHRATALTRANSQTHKPQLTFNLRPAELQSPRGCTESSLSREWFRSEVINIFELALVLQFGPAVGKGSIKSLYRALLKADQRGEKHEEKPNVKIERGQHPCSSQISPDPSMCVCVCVRHLSSCACMCASVSAPLRTTAGCLCMLMSTWLFVSGVTSARVCGGVQAGRKLSHYV